MRIRVLMLTAAVGLAACVTIKPPATPSATTPPTAVTSDSTQTAVWIQRNLHVAVFGESCEDFYQFVRLALLQLGARASDLNVKLPADECHLGPFRKVGVDATFWVLAPIDDTLRAALQERFGEKNAAGEVVEAHWQPVELKEGALRFGARAIAEGRDIDSTALNEMFGSLGNPPRCVLVTLFKQQIVPLFFTKDAKLIDNCNLRVRVLDLGRHPK